MKDMVCGWQQYAQPAENPASGADAASRWLIVDQVLVLSGLTLINLVLILSFRCKTESNDVIGLSANVARFRLSPE